MTSSASEAVHAEDVAQEMDNEAAARDEEQELAAPGTLQHADSMDLLRANPPHFHPARLPPTFRVGVQPVDSDASEGGLEVSSNQRPPSDNGGASQSRFMSHADSCDLLRKNPPHFDPANAPQPQPFRAGAQNCDSDAASDGASPAEAAAGSPGSSPVTQQLHHVDSNVVLRAHLRAHPPKKRESPLQPVSFRVGERAQSPKAEQEQEGESSNGSMDSPETSRRTFRHVDSVEIIRKHPPQPGPSPLGPTSFQVGRPAKEDGDEGAAAAAVEGEGAEKAEEEVVESGEEAEGGVAEGSAPLSKRQQKKLAKRQKTMERHAERKQREKAEKAKVQEAKKAEYNAYVASLAPEEKEEFQAKMAAKRQSRLEATAAKRAKLKEAMDNGQRVAVDLDFEDKMNDGELRSLCQQLSYCYSANCNSEKPFCLHYTSLRGKVEENLLRQAAGLPKWQLNYGPGSYMDTFKQEELVYLTADSPNVLTDLDPAKVYVIGGIVDRNRYKGICYSKAVEQGIETAALPINMELNTSRVLTVNHVLEIMLRYAECGSWPEAVEKVVPGRKRTAPDVEDDTSTPPVASKQPKHQEEPSSVPVDDDAGITDES